MPLPLIRPGIVREELEHKNQRRKKVPPCKEKLFACRSRLGDASTSCWGREEVEAGSRGERWFWKLRPTWSSPLLRCAAPRRDLRSLTAALRPSADVAALLRTRTPVSTVFARRAPSCERHGRCAAWRDVGSIPEARGKNPASGLAKSTRNMAVARVTQSGIGKNASLRLRRAAGMKWKSPTAP